MASVVVRDDDALPMLTIANVTTGPVSEGTEITFRLNASRESALIVEGNGSSLPVNLSFGGDINDFVSLAAGLPRTVDIPSGDSEVDFVVVTDNDLLDEANGEISVTISPGENYLVGTAANATASIEIEDNDSPILTIAAGPSIIEGGIANFELDLIPAPAEAMMVYVDVTQIGNVIEAEEYSKPLVVEIGTKW